MPSKFHYYVDSEADRKLARHLEFLARVSEKAATHLYEAYRNAIRYIEDHASGCPLYYSSKLTNIELRSWPFGKHYRIVFEIVGDDAFAYDIQDCRQNPDNNLV